MGPWLRKLDDLLLHLYRRLTVTVAIRRRSPSTTDIVFRGHPRSPLLALIQACIFTAIVCGGFWFSVTIGAKLSVPNLKKPFIPGDPFLVGSGMFLLTVFAAAQTRDWWRGLRIRLDGHAFEFHGEVEVDGVLRRGIHCWPAGDVLSISQSDDGTIAIDIEAVGRCRIGVGWTWRGKPREAINALLQWRRSICPRPLQHRVAMPEIEPAKTLSYSTRATLSDTHVVHTHHSVQIIVGTVLARDRKVEFFHRGWPGFHLLGSTFGLSGRTSESIAFGYPAEELTLTADEIWLITRTTVDRIRRFQRDQIVEFRQNRFSPIFYVRLRGQEPQDVAGEWLVDARLVPLALEHILPLMSRIEDPPNVARR